MIIGHFYFKRTNNNNLTGEFSNIRTTIVSSESADIIENGNHPFDFRGKYSSTWQEDKEAFLGDLEIGFKNNEAHNIPRVYTLEWRGEGFRFFGEGFLVDDMLIGSYWDNEVDQIVRQQS